MKQLPPFPEVPIAEQTPWRCDLLRIIEELRERVQCLEEENGRLKDEIAVLKGEKARPKFKPGRMEPQADPLEGTEADGKRPGSKKRSKTLELTIHREVKCPPPAVPEGSRFEGYEP